MKIRRTFSASTVAALAICAFAPVALADTVTGTSISDRLTGKVGPTTIRGRGGPDVLYGDPVAGAGKPRKMERVSVGSLGGPGSSLSGSPSVTADGRTMFFVSNSQEFLPPGVAASGRQVFRKNLVTGSVALVTSRPDGDLLKGEQNQVAVSPNGRYVAFTSNAINIPNAPMDPGQPPHIILKDLLSGTYRSVSRTASSLGNGESSNPVFSPDSTMLAFTSAATNLISGDSNARLDVFIVRISSPTNVYLASAGITGQTVMNGDSGFPVFSPDSKSLAFTSSANTVLAPNAIDFNNVNFDVFIKSLSTFDPTGRISGAVQLVSTSDKGFQDNSGHSLFSSFSPDGREIAFVSTADDLAADGNGSGMDVFIKTIKSGGPRPAGTIRIVSRSSTGAQGTGDFQFPAFSPDGTRLAFVSSALDLAGSVTDGTYQILMKDVTKSKGAMTLISRQIAIGGAPGNLNSADPVFIGHGEKLLFTSYAQNLVTADINGTQDIFLATLGAPAVGNDIIKGGDGNDVLIGGRGADRLSGGSGADRFVYLSIADSKRKLSRRDTIFDFNVAQEDIIDLSAIDANPVLSGKQAFKFIGSKSFDGRRGLLRFANGILSADTTGNRRANFAVKVNVSGGKLTSESIRR